MPARILTDKPPDTDPPPEDPEQKNYCGRLRIPFNASPSLVAIGVVFVAYVARVLPRILTGPPPSEATLLWTSMEGLTRGKHGPLFPVELGCSADGGCVFSSRYSGLTPRSLACAADAAFDCTRVDQGGTLTVASLCYSDLPYDGIVATHNVTASGAIGVTVYGVSEATSQFPLMKFATPLHAGRTQLQLVATTNRTYARGALGHRRLEFFPTYLGADVGGSGALALQDCALLAPAAATASSSSPPSVTLIAIGPSWIEVRPVARYDSEVGRLIPAFTEMQCSRCAVFDPLCCPMCLCMRSCARCATGDR